MIRILPDVLANQIAAGEVVQRPASVVKELVENSLDAGARRIIIEIETGGKSLIQVSDDGCGLSRDQALLAIERYATSKIRTGEDLFSIATFGFRGEALPAIASVSRFALETRTREDTVATRLEMAGGKLTGVSETGAPPGTLIQVKHLFFNTPARRKFLKADATEGAHIADVVAGMALGNPKTGFTLRVSGRQVRQFPPAQDLFHRALLVLGSEVTDRLYEVAACAADIRVSGVCAHPAVTRSGHGRLYFFVNNRLVYDRGLLSAVFQGYKGRIMTSRYPVGVICVHLPCDQVDVNVHPAKREIKFLNGQQVYPLVASAVSQALEQGQTAGALTYSRAGEGPRVQSCPAPVPFRSDPDPVAVPGTLAWGEGSPEKPADSGRVAEERTGPGPSEMNLMGQVMGGYIVAEYEGALLLVDPHAAHERIVYEALCRRHTGMPVAAQSLMVPETVELGHAEADILTEMLADLSRMGLQIEPFGGTTFVIRSVPALLADRPVRDMVVDMVESLSEKKVSGSPGKWIEDCLISMACHTAVRGAKTLSPQEMQVLLTDLLACDNPFHCPHGRPTLVSFDRDHMEKLFKRVV